MPPKRNADSAMRRDESKKQKSDLEKTNNNDAPVRTDAILGQRRITRSVATGIVGVNFLFYSNQIPSQPSGDLIDVIHTKWFGDHRMLESHHGYIQWLFPVFESSGMNWHSSNLSKAEAKLIRDNLECAKRVVKSYHLMLHFYGMELLNEETGEIGRHPENWQERYHNLNTSSHNHLRVSRILTSLGQLGFRRYKKPLLEHLKKEVAGGPLNRAEYSLKYFWKPLLEENSKWYTNKTQEAPSDQRESVFFAHLKNNSNGNSGNNNDNANYNSNANNNSNNVSASKLNDSDTEIDDDNTTTNKRKRTNSNNNNNNNSNSSSNNLSKSKSRSKRTNSNTTTASSTTLVHVMGSTPNPSE